MADEITDASAIQILQSFVFERRAFKRAEDILQAVIAGKQFLEGLEKEKKAKEFDIGQLETARQAAEERKRAAELKAARARDDTEGVKAALQKEIDEITAKKKQAQADFEKFKAKLEADKVDLENSLKAKAAEWDKLKAAFTNFKAEHRL